MLCVVISRGVRRWVTCYILSSSDTGDGAETERLKVFTLKTLCIKAVLVFLLTNFRFLSHGLGGVINE